MPDLHDMALEEVESRYPALASAVACIRPFMTTLDQSNVMVYSDGTYFEVLSSLNLPDVPSASQKWSARFLADKVRVRGFVNQGWAWVSDKSETFSFEQFAAVLQKLIAQQKQSGKAPKRRKPAARRPAPASPKGQRRKKNNP